MIKNKNFLLENALIEKDSIIEKLNNDLIHLLKYPLFREQKRDEKVNPNDIEEELIDDFDYYQDLLLCKSKGFNKYSTKVKILQEKISQYNQLTTNNSKNILTTLISLKPYNLKETLNSSESYEDYFDELNSDSDDVNFTDNIDNRNCIKNHENKIQIPKIDLKQIEYNKRKYRNDDEEISLSRSNNDDDSLMESKIRSLKQKIKNLKRRVKNKFEKIQKYEQRIPEMKRILNNYKINYEDEFTKNGNRSERIYLSRIIEE